MFGKHAYLSFLRIVGTRAFVHVEGYTTNLHPKAWEGVIVGYYSDKPTFRMSDRYTGRISSSRDVSFIEEPLTVLPTADSATSQARARQLALQRQEYPKQQFGTVSQYTRAVGKDKTNRPVSISVPNTYAQPMALPQAEECKLSAASARRSTTSARRTPSKLQTP